MLAKLLVDVEEIINTLACNDAQPIEIRGAFNAAINLRAFLEQINPNDMPKEEVKVVQEPVKFKTPDIDPQVDNTDNKTKE